MRKCPSCNSCFTIFWYYGKIYKCCSLCRTVYSVIPGGQLEEVTDPSLKNTLLNLVGRRI